MVRRRCRQLLGQLREIFSAPRAQIIIARPIDLAYVIFGADVADAEHEDRKRQCGERPKDGFVHLLLPCF
jgi:hypothetical protein